jgi:hypothetical protein
VRPYPPRRQRLHRQHPSASVSIRQHTSAYVSIRQHPSAYVSIRQHTSAYVSIRQHPSASVSIRQHTLRRAPDTCARAYPPRRQRLNQWITQLIN